MSGAMDSVDTYSSGMGAYGATPFVIDGKHTMYIDTSGYLWGAGSNTNNALYNGFGSGINSSSTPSFIKMGTSTTGGASAEKLRYAIDFDITADHDGVSIVVDQYGKVWTSGSNNASYGYPLGWGSSYTASSYQYFRTVATGTGNYLPSNYQAVAVAAGGRYANMILTSTGALYGAGRSSYLGGAATTSGTFTRLDGVASGLPAATTSNPIIDFSCGYQCSYVLYKDGSLYHGSSTWTKVNPTGVSFKMMDKDAWVNTCYAVSSDNKIYYSSGSSTTMTLLVSTPTGTVTQIRSGGYGGGWGYLNSAGALYLTTSSTGTPTTNSYYNSGVTFFDIGGCSGDTYGMIQNGVTKMWGNGSNYNLGNGSTGTVSVSSPFTPSNVDTSYGPNRDISNTPPAIMIFRIKNNL